MANWIVIVEKPSGARFAALKQAPDRESAVLLVEDWAEESKVVAVTCLPAAASFVRLATVERRVSVDVVKTWGMP